MIDTNIIEKEYDKRQSVQLRGYCRAGGLGLGTLGAGRGRMLRFHDDSCRRSSRPGKLDLSFPLSLSRRDSLTFSGGHRPFAGLHPVSSPWTPGDGSFLDRPPASLEYFAPCSSDHQQPRATPSTGVHGGGRSVHRVLDEDGLNKKRRRRRTYSAGGGGRG